MDEMYNNQNDYQNTQNEPYPQPTIQEQLNYQYQEPRSEMEEPMTLGEWMITFLLLLIPCANIVLAFVWAFSSKEKKSKSNFFKAYLIFMAIMIVFYIILFIVMGASMATMMGEIY